MMIWIIVALGAVGFAMMVAAFGLVAARGGWVRAMQSDAQGRWPLARWLMLAGAACGVLFGLSIFLPGVIPWWDYSSPSFNWTLGAVFAAGVAFVCWQVSQARRPRRA
jgi:hypothetical protein